MTRNTEHLLCMHAFPGRAKSQRKLLEEDADSLFTDENEDTALHHAVRNGHKTIARDIIESFKDKTEDLEEVSYLLQCLFYHC